MTTIPDPPPVHASRTGLAITLTLLVFVATVAGVCWMVWPR